MTDSAQADIGPADTAVADDVRRRSWIRSPLATVVAVTIAVALPLIVAVATLSGRRWFPVLDLAMTEFRVRDVGGRHTPLIGLPGRIGTFPEQGSHPGPISFWLVAPGYRLFGSSAWAMEAATVMIQTAWIAVALWIGHRRAQLAGVLVVALVIAVLLRGYGLVVLIQPWNPYLPLIAWIVVLLATWSVVCGDHMMLVPLVVAASFAAQTHIPYLLMAGGLGLFAVAVVLVRCWRSDDRRSFVRPLAWTGGLFAVLWLAPLVEQIRHDPGNLRRLIDHFTSPTEDVIGWRTGGNVLLRHLDFVDGYLRLLTGTSRFLQVGFEPGGRIWPGALLLAAMDRLGRGRRADAASLPDRTRHGDRGDAAAVARVDGPHLRHRLVLPHALGLGHDDAPDRRHRVDSGDLVHRCLAPTHGESDPDGAAGGGRPGHWCSVVWWSCRW